MMKYFKNKTIEFPTFLLLFLTLSILLLFPPEAKSLENISTFKIGHTNNINLEQTDKDPDQYFLIGHEVSTELDHFTYQASGFYSNYKDQSDYDSFSWGLGLTTVGKAQKDNSSYWTIDLSGQHYLSQDPASSDTAFDYLSGAIGYIIKTKVNESHSYSYTTAFDFTKYSEEVSRRDNQLSFNADYEYILGEESSLTPQFGLGFISSSSSVYTKLFYQAGLEWLWLFAQDFELSSYISYGKNIYIKRTVSTDTIIKRKKKSFTFSDTSLERHTSVYLSVSLTKNFESCDIIANVYRNKNTTNSDNEDYAEFGLGITFRYFYD